MLSHIRVGDWLSDAHTYLQSVGQGIKKAYDTPTCPARNNQSYSWIISKIRIEEAEAGDHGFLYIDCDAAVASTGDDLVDDPYQDVWSMTWQAYSVDPYNFLSGLAPEPYPCTPAFETDPENYLPPADHWTRTGSRAHIDKYLNGIGESKKV